MRELIGPVLGLVFVAMCSLCVWSCERQFNYRYGYEDQVKQTMKPLEERLKKVEEDLQKLNGK